MARGTVFEFNVQRCSIVAGQNASKRRAVPFNHWCEASNFLSTPLVSINPVVPTASDFAN